MELIFPVVLFIMLLKLVVTVMTVMREIAWSACHHIYESFWVILFHGVLFIMLLCAVVEKNAGKFDRAKWTLLFLLFLSFFRRLGCTPCVKKFWLKRFSLANSGSLRCDTPNGQIHLFLKPGTMLMQTSNEFLPLILDLMDKEKRKT